MTQTGYPLNEYDIPFLQTVSNISGLSAAVLSDTVVWHSHTVPIHPCEQDPVLLKTLTEVLPGDHPGIFMENEYIFWGLLRCADAVIAIGPALLNKPSEDYEKRYAALHNASEAMMLRKLPTQEMADYLSLISIHLFGAPCALETLAYLGAGSEHYAWESERDYSHYYVDQSEHDRTHRRGRDFENAIASAVRAGDVEQARKLVGGSMPGVSDSGKVADEERKQIEYMIVSLLTILTRAAEEGGLPSEAAHDVGDIYLKRLSRASLSGAVLTTLGHRAIIEFAALVQKAKEEHSSVSHVEACKAYIDANLLKNIQVSEIAPALGLSRTYLAHLFKEAEGITVQKYIQREKCRKAQRLLIYSDYPLTLISEYLAFSSPGYFGSCFQQWYGMTPGQYRRAYSKK